jgi:hypothetical protein
MADAPTRPVMTGLVLLGLLSVLDVLSPAVFPAPGDGQAGPPAWIVSLVIVLGVASLLLIGLIVRGGGRIPAIGLVVCRVLSAITGVPAFFEPDVPGWIVASVALFILLTAAGCMLVRPTLRPREAASG